MITSKELAKIAGVSQSTVSRALNDSPLVPFEKKETIKKLAQQHGFLLNSQARSLKINKTGTVGILFPKYFVNLSTNLFYTHIYDLVQQELNKHGFDIMVIYDYGGNENMSSFERMIKLKKVDGFIIICSNLNEYESGLISQYNVPCVGMFNPLKRVSGLSYFTTDSEHAGFLAGDYLGRFEGWSYLSITSGHQNNDCSRLAGFKRGLSHHSKLLNDDRIINCDLSMESAYNAVMSNRNLFCKPTAVYAYNDIIAIGAINALKDLNIDIPNEVQIIGTDDIPMSGWVRPQLSTVHTQAMEIVSQGCCELLKLIGGENTTVDETKFKPLLVARDTTL